MKIHQFEVDSWHVAPLGKLYFIAGHFCVVDNNVAFREHLEIRAVVHHLHHDLLTPFHRSAREFEQGITYLASGLG